MRLHKEGRFIILINLIILAIIIGCINLIDSEQTIYHLIIYGVLFIFTVVVVRFFRVPLRDCDPSDYQVLSVADGKVVTIEEVYEKEYFKDNRILISVFMSINNAHVNWFPISGIVKYVNYHEGNYLIASHPKSSEENERSTVVVENKNQQAILFRQIAGWVARRIVCYPKEGDIAEQGKEMGFIKFGSRIDIYLPLDADIKVRLHQKVKGKTTILAELN
ncbi:MAG: phosphatidylserine decarboxylase family protein [Bacteroidales bacterium]|nr:phosphatidylserine decarboxylase family protein [Bacteroidales bacterium]